ncbi:MULTISPECIES: hypothetical protein [unclassified Rhizobium]|uniref:hypothetical protein n=1 Tax=unclassified Rhizobium TaxID=2613769 RepID=UPI000648E3CC|nr:MULTISPECIES: hypothetical protein [unclassified Rhizobium]RKD61748.1 hypothetical protein BJ928_107350 [Rhizobium sp. WW_1]
MPAINTRTRLASMPWVVLAFAVNPLPAFAEECVQEKAVYVDMDNAYELRFEPMGSESSVSNKFKLAVRNTAIVAEGIVMHGDDQPGADGRIMFECPEGDVTGADLRACTVWQGMIYASDLKGHIRALPGEGQSAADRLFLPALGPSIQKSSLWGKGKATVAPWDVLSLKGCNQ